ncbi:tetratricopeptide repeat protein [bacterium]|nr:tetratricopeptide repeat protein [bacterium]
MSTTDIQNKKIKKEIDKFQKSGNIQKAIDACKGALSADENNAELHIKLGDLYMEWHLDIHQSKQYADDAITEYQRALETDVDSAEIYYKIGMAFYYKRELDKAVNYFKLVLEHNVKMSEAYFMLAEIFMRKGDFLEAMENAQRAIKIAPLTSSRAYFLVYCIQSLSNKVKWYKKLPNLIASFCTLPFDKYAMKAVGKNLSYLKFVPSLLKISFLIMREGFSEKIIDMYREMIDKAPGFVELYILLGKVYTELQRYDDAICEYKMAIWLDSLNVDAYYYLCLLYEEQKDYDNAILVCEKLVELQPQVADYHCKIAQYKYLKGEVDEAVTHYQTAVAINPNPKWTSVVALTLGFIFQENSKNFDAAIASYQNAHNLNPDDIEIFLNLGNVFFEKGSYDNALVVYKKALEASPYNSRLHCNLGYLYWGKGNIEEAVKEYEKAIKYDNTYDIAYNNLGVIYLDDLGRVQKAIELFEAAIKNNPNYALANYNLARSIAITGDKIEAAKLFQTALDINNYTQEIDPRDIEDKIQDLFT